MEKTSTRRSQTFHPNHDPQHTEPILERHKFGIVHGPFASLNPTRAFSHPLSLRHIPKPARGFGHVRSHEQLVTGDVRFKWRSRDNRKGRHTLLVIPSKEAGKATYIVPRETPSIIATFHGIGRLFTTVRYWDISYLTAVIFTIGSIIWVINAFFVWLPLVRPSTEFKNEILTGGGITAFVGATVFEFGSFFLILEAINKHDTGCFGWDLAHILTEKGGSLIHIHSKKGEEGCTHHHSNRRNLVGKSRKRPAATYPSDEQERLEQGKVPESGGFKWFPSYKELRTHYMYELGFLASFFQLIGASIFWISGFTALPGINNHLSQNLADGIYRAPQIAGGSFFIISGALFTIETQRKWYIPAPHVLGWHIGFWNFIGGIGFTLSGIFSLAYKNSGLQYQDSLSTFWGSWAFLIGSVIQWYESLEKYPVEVASEKKIA